jgi:ABC-type sugar transport system ATPase subunit
MNFLNIDEAAALLPASALPAAAETVGIRPQNLRPAESGMALTVDLAEALGTETVIHGHLASGTKMIVTRAGQLPAHPGELLHFAAEPGKLHVFDVEGARIDF